jgi:hypothetical protein
VTLMLPGADMSCRALRCIVTACMPLHHAAWPVSGSHLLYIIEGSDPHVTTDGGCAGYLVDAA